MESRTADGAVEQMEATAVRDRREGDALVVLLPVEATPETAVQLREVLLAAYRDTARVVVEMEGVERCHLAVGQVLAAVERERPLVVRHAEESVRRALGWSGVRG